MLLTKYHTYVVREEREMQSADTPDAVVALLRELRMHEELDEKCVAIFLSTKNIVLGMSEISHGGLNEASITPRALFREAINLPCAGIIIAHNHPSGDPTPSQQDISITERMIEAGKIMAIPIVDHIIIGSEGSHSMRELGDIEFN